MPKRIVRGSRGKMIRDLHTLVTEVNPELLVESSAYFDQMVEKGVNGARITNNYGKRDRSNRNGRRRIPYVPSAGVSVVSAVELGLGYKDMDGWLEKTGNDPVPDEHWEESSREALSDYGYDQDEFNIPRYIKREETGGGYDFTTKHQREKSVKINAVIDNQLASGKNPFRPEKRSNFRGYRL